jgi:hypothetical protein
MSKDKKALARIAAGADPVAMGKAAHAIEDYADLRDKGMGWWCQTKTFDWHPMTPREKRILRIRS